MKSWILIGISILIANLSLAQQKVDFTQLVNRTHTERTMALFDYYEQDVSLNDSTAIFNDISAMKNWLSCTMTRG